MPKCGKTISHNIFNNNNTNIIDVVRLFTWQKWLYRLWFTIIVEKLRIVFLNTTCVKGVKMRLLCCCPHNCVFVLLIVCILVIPMKYVQACDFSKSQQFLSEQKYDDAELQIITQLKDSTCDYRLIDFEHGNTDHRDFTAKVVLSNYLDRHTETELP